MSRCGRTAHLEAVALGEASPAIAHELRTHAKQCALCRHELNWLESESAMFRQRAGRDEVAELWKGVAERRGLAVPHRSWPRMLVAMAAAAVLMVMVGRSAPAPVSMATDGSHAVAEETLESSMLASPAFLFFEEREPCSKLPSGVGFQCSPVVPASFLASR
jgi:hypothetical protein